MNSVISIPFDEKRPPHEQLEAAIASVPSRPCERHSHELRLMDKGATLRRTLIDCRLEFTAIYDRCPECPHNKTNTNIKVQDCAVGSLHFGRLAIRGRGMTESWARREWPQAKRSVLPGVILSNRIFSVYGQKW
jgi:hypothetical protein